MTIEELFRQLSYGELSNLAIAVDSTGTLKKSQQNRIVHFANEALKRLYTRFPLGEEMAIVPLEGEEMEYELPEDLLQVTAILTERGESLDFTTTQDPHQISVLGRTLHIPVQILQNRHQLRQGAEIQIVFTTRHPPLSPIVEDQDLQQEIELPAELEEALTAYIASKMYGTMNTPEHLTAAANYRNQFETTCAEVQHHGLLPTEIRSSVKFDKRGWV